MRRILLGKRMGQSGIVGEKILGWKIDVKNSTWKINQKNLNNR